MIDIKELIARAIWECEYCTEVTNWDKGLDAPHPLEKFSEIQARYDTGMTEANVNPMVRNIFTALESAGYAIVPVEPTEKMIEEGEAELIAFDRRFDTFQDGAKDIFRAMLQAHKGEG